MKRKRAEADDELSRLEKFGTLLRFGDRLYEIDMDKNPNGECVSPGTNSQILYIKDVQTLQHLVLKLLRDKYTNHEAYGHGERLAQEVSYQMMASERGLAPRVLDHGWTSHPDNNERMVQFILMEDKGESLDHVDTDDIDLEDLKRGIQSLYRGLGNLGLQMNEISLENTVRDSDGTVYAIDFDPEGVHLTRGVADNHTTELLEYLEVALGQEESDYSSDTTIEEQQGDSSLDEALWQLFGDMADETSEGPLRRPFVT